MRTVLPYDYIYIALISRPRVFVGSSPLAFRLPAVFRGVPVADLRRRDVRRVWPNVPSCHHPAFELLNFPSSDAVLSEAPLNGSGCSNLLPACCASACSAARRVLPTARVRAGTSVSTWCCDLLPELLRSFATPLLDTSLAAVPASTIGSTTRPNTAAHILVIFLSSPHRDVSPRRACTSTL